MTHSLMRSFTGFGLLTVALLGCRGPLSAQVASPLQAGHYVPGVINIRDLVLPPSGFFVIWYNWYVSTDTYVDRNGSELNSLNLSQLDPTLPDVDVDLELKGFATVPALAWASTFEVLGARYIAAISPNFVVADYTLVAEAGGPGFEPVENRTLQGDVSGFSDLLVAPVGLSWGLGRFGDESSTSSEESASEGLPTAQPFNLTFTYAFAAPTGRYETGADDNIGLGFWTHQFQAFGYFFPFEHQATGIMAGLTYELNGQIKDVDVTPGRRLSLDWGVSQYLAPWFELGVQGAHNWQVTDDSGSDVFWDPTLHDKKNSLLFSAGFWPWEQRFYVSAKYGFEYGARQRFKSNNLMLNLIWVTNWLNGS